MLATVKADVMVVLQKLIWGGGGGGGTCDTV